MSTKKATAAKVYGYARISTAEQSIDRQIKNIQSAYPTAKIEAEAYTGRKIQGRVKLERIIKKAKAGDTIVFDEISRMSRNAAEGFALYQELYSRGVCLVFLKEPHLNSDVYQKALAQAVPMTGGAVDVILKAINEYLMLLAQEQIKLAFERSQAEVDYLSQRTREGMKAAYERAEREGRELQKGQRPGAKLHTKKSDSAKAYILQRSKAFGGTLTDKECMKLAGVSKNSYYKYKGELIRQAAGN